MAESHAEYTARMLVEGRVETYQRLAEKLQADNEALRAALTEARNFACFDPVDNDPCECCLHVADVVGALHGEEA